MKMKIQTTSGDTIIDTEKISAITEKIVKTGFLVTPTITLDIHMDSGTIFEWIISDSKRVVLLHAWGVEDDE